MAATFPTRLGGSGRTYTADADPVTGFLNGGHEQNFPAALEDVVAMAEYMAKYGGVIDDAAENADRAENARGYVEAYASRLQSGLLDDFARHATIDLDFARGRYRFDDGDCRESNELDDIGHWERSAVVYARGPNGRFRVVNADRPGRSWGLVDGRLSPIGAVVSNRVTNFIADSHDMSAASAWSRYSMTVSDDGGSDRMFEDFDSQKLIPPAGEGFSRVSNFVDLVANDYTLYAYVKADGMNRVYIQPMGGQNSVFDLKTGEIAQAEGVKSGVIDQGDGWRLIWSIFRVQDDVLGAEIRFGIRDSLTGSSAATGDGVSGVRVNGMFLTDSRGVMSPLPTTGSPATSVYERSYVEMGRALYSRAFSFYFELSEFEWLQYLVNNASYVTLVTFKNRDNADFGGVGVQTDRDNLTLYSRSYGTSPDSVTITPGTATTYRVCASIDFDRRVLTFAVNGKSVEGALEGDIQESDITRLYFAGAGRLSGNQRGVVASSMHLARVITRPGATTEAAAREITA